MPIIGSVCYMVGSCFFWPNLYAMEWAGVLAASLFTAGSIFFMSAPILDYIDMSASYANLRHPPLGGDDAAKLHWLYMTQLMRTQRANTILYSVGGACFVAGSVLFFPSWRAEATHGAWLYLTGCFIVFLAALLATFTALELKKTSAHHAFPRRWWALYWWSDEDAQIFSCSLYMVGNAVFAAGSICFFPKISFLGGVVIEDERLSEIAAAVLFIVGSPLFLIGSTVDLLTYARDDSEKQTEASVLVPSKTMKPV